MDREQTKQAIEVMRAFAEGKIVEERLRIGIAWAASAAPFCTPLWDWSNYEYRVKREPRTFYINCYRDNSFAYNSRDEADRRAASDRIQCIKVVEVFE